MVGVTYSSLTTPKLFIEGFTGCDLKSRVVNDNFTFRSNTIVIDEDVNLLLIKKHSIISK